MKCFNISILGMKCIIKKQGAQTEQTRIMKTITSSENGAPIIFLKFQLNNSSKLIIATYEEILN